MTYNTLSEIIPSSLTDPTLAANMALLIGAYFGRVVIAPIGTGISDVARESAIRFACSGKYEVIRQPGLWYLPAPTMIYSGDQLPIYPFAHNEALLGAWTADYGIVQPVFGGTDWSCAAAGTAAWTKSGAGTIIKAATAPSGANTLRISGSATFAYQVGSSTNNSWIRVRGYARSNDGVGVPVIMNASLAAQWTGTINTSWQWIDTWFLANGTALPILYCLNAGAVEFYDLICETLNVTSWANQVRGGAPFVGVSTITSLYVDPQAYCGAPALNGNGTTQYMTCDSIASILSGKKNAPFTIIAAAKVNAPALLQCVWMLAHTSAGGAYTSTYDGSGAYKFYHYDDTTASSTQVVGAQDTALRIFTWRFNGATVDFFVDGSCVCQGASLSGGIATLNCFTIGAWRRLGVQASYTSMTIGGLLVINSAITEQQRIADENWLMAKTTPIPVVEYK